jgi:NADPH:quinone reductase-like Zn-dependent oxidoreductase
LQLQDIETPVPEDDEIRIRIRATTVSAGDAELRGLKFSPLVRPLFRAYVGIDRPRRMTVLGQELAGEVELVGKDVTRFKPGDAVFGTPGLRLGGYAEYTCMPANGALARKPDGVTYEQAATLPVGGIEALHALRQAELRSGESILVNGAGGCIGTYAVQLAKNLGAEVTAVDSTPKLEMLRSIGADQVLDYTREDFTRRGEQYDVVFDVIGKAPFAGVLRSLKPGGRFAVGNPKMVHRLGRTWAEATGRAKVFTWSSGMSEENLAYLAGEIEAGRIKAVIDRAFPLEQTAEAHRYAETGEKKGHIVITVG